MFANATNADLVLSLHCDAPRHLAARRGGSPAYYYGVGATRGAGAARTRQSDSSSPGCVQREVVARTDLLDCGIHGKTWDLLRRTRMPAVRLEVGYVTHPGDAARLADPAFRDTVAEAATIAVQRLTCRRRTITPRVCCGCPSSSADRHGSGTCWRCAPTGNGCIDPSRRSSATSTSSRQVSTVRRSSRSRGKRGCGRTVLNPMDSR